jgi:FolB domain-containing protein
MNDWIHIRDLTVPCIIGTKPDEREHRQNVVINLTLDCDLSVAGRSDRLEDTVNYMTLKKKVLAHVEASQFFLIERLAQTIADLCLEDPRVSAVRVSVDKPGALTRARSVAVEIERRRG